MRLTAVDRAPPPAPGFFRLRLRFGGGSPSAASAAAGALPGGGARAPP